MPGVLEYLRLLVETGILGHIAQGPFLSFEVKPFPDEDRLR